MARKTHFASVECGNESNPHDEWGKTACGLELDDKHLSNNKKFVTCGNCLKILIGYDDWGFKVEQKLNHCWSPEYD